MRKKSTIIIAAAVLALFVFGFIILSKNEWGLNMQNKDYQWYHGPQPYLGISFKYPNHWRLMEDKGKIDSYTQAVVIGPRNADDTYASTFVLRGSPLKNKNGRFENIEQLKQNYVTHLYKNPSFLSQSSAKVQNHLAEDITVIYTLPPMHHKGLKSKEVPVKARALFVQNGDNLYEFIYNADEKEFEKYITEFESVLKSLRFDKVS